MPVYVYLHPTANYGIAVHAVSQEDARQHVKSSSHRDCRFSHEGGRCNENHIGCTTEEAQAQIRKRNRELFG